MAIGKILNVPYREIPNEFDFTRTSTSDWITAGINTGNTAFWSITYGVKIHFSRIDSGSASITSVDTFSIRSNSAKLVLQGSQQNNHGTTTTYVYVSTDNGSNWTSVASTTSLTPSFNIDLSTYKGLTLKFRVAYSFSQNETQNFDITNMKLTY